MNKPLLELIAFLENYNRWRRSSYLYEQPVPEELGQRLDQAVELLKKMTWQPMETAPEDREFLGVWGSVNGKIGGYDTYKYIGNGLYESMNAVDERWPNKFYKIFAWMDIPKYNP
jgi:hypothetical protein